MFHDGSRYANTPRDTVDTADGRKARAIRLRRQLHPPAVAHVVAQDDRLDLLAQSNFGDGTRYWHIADANSALEAKTLVARVLDTVKIPRS